MATEQGLDGVSKKMEEMGSGVTAFLKQLGENFRNEGLSGVQKSFQSAPRVGRMLRRVFEISLVPAVKAEMLKTQKFRNLMIFVCLVVGVGSGIVMAATAAVTAGQKMIIQGKKEHLDIASKKVMGFSDLNDFLTVQGQMSKIAEIGARKKQLSRTFGFLTTMAAIDRDKVTFSKVNVDLDAATLKLDGIADANKDPLIDYRVLEVFKKNAEMMRYDHGRYVNKDGTTIPVACIEDTDGQGRPFTKDGLVYALWYNKEKDCGATEEEQKMMDADYESKKTEEERKAEEQRNTKVLEEMIDRLSKKQQEQKKNGDGRQQKDEQKDEKNTQEKMKQDAVRQAKKRFESAPIKIWRTPKFEEWMKSGNMNNNGEIQGIAHFESACIKYSPITFEGSTRLEAENNCKFMQEEMQILNSSNGRSGNEKLVLNFEAKLQLNPEVYSFKNKHLLAISPTNQNATDSYTQLQSLFEKRAEDCKPGDTACVKEIQNIKEGGDKWLKLQPQKQE